MGYIYIGWQEKNNDEDGFRIYRSLSPMDIDNMPSPLANLPPNSTSYKDEDVEEEETYYYRDST